MHLGPFSRYFDVILACFANRGCRKTGVRDQGSEKLDGKLVLSHPFCDETAEWVGRPQCFRGSKGFTNHPVGVGCERNAAEGV